MAKLKKRVTAKAKPSQTKRAKTQQKLALDHALTIELDLSPIVVEDPPVEQPSVVAGPGLGWSVDDRLELSIAGSNPVARPQFVEPPIGSRQDLRGVYVGAKWRF